VNFFLRKFNFEAFFGVKVGFLDVDFQHISFSEVKRSRGRGPLESLLRLEKPVSVDSSARSNMRSGGYLGKEDMDIPAEI
jgi:hypothetical protein